MSIIQEEKSYSYQENAWSDITLEVSSTEVLEFIRSERLKQQIQLLRKNLNSGNKEFYDNHKKKLPAVTFSGTFNSKRKKENLKKYNSLLVLDIDKLNEEEMQSIEAILNTDKYVRSYWKSPSNKGFKGLVSLKFTRKLKVKNVDYFHKQAFIVVSNYFLEKYSIVLDKSGSDISRLCFLSWDPAIVNKDSFEMFLVEDNNFEQKEKIPLKKEKQLRSFANIEDALYNSKDRNSPYDRKLMSNIIRYLNQNKLSITQSYEDWCKVAMALASSFTFNVGRNYFIKLSKRDKEKFNEVNCLNFLSSCYENRRNEVTFSSIVYLANQQGFTTKYQKNGVPKAEGV